MSKANYAQMVEAPNSVEPCILDSSPWKDLLIERNPGRNHDFLKDQHALWPRLLRLPRLIYDVIEYNRFCGTNDKLNRALWQRAHELHRDLDLSSLEYSSLESLQIEFQDPNNTFIAGAYGVMAATNYVCILTATIILIDRLIRFLDIRYYSTKDQLFSVDGELATEESALEKLLRASYSWWKALSPASAHSKHADMMWSASFKAVDSLDKQGTWEEAVSGPAISKCQEFYNKIALHQQWDHLPVSPRLTN